MFGESDVSPRETFFYFFKDNIDAVRCGKWKLHIRKGEQEIKELHDLEADIGETNNLYNEYPDIVKKLMAKIEEFREDIGDEAVGMEGKNCRPIGKVDNPVPNPDSNLCTMDSPALLYAAEFTLNKELSIENKRKIVCTLADSEDPILFDFFNDLLLESEDSQIKRFTSRGLERIIRKRAKDINENGKIILKK